MSFKIFGTTCNACGKSAEAHVAEADFQYKNRFTGEWEWSNDAVVQKHCHHTRNPIHLQNAGTLSVSWQEFQRK